MRHITEKWRVALAVIAAGAAVASCDMMTEDLSDCPVENVETSGSEGLYLTLAYDYNLYGRQGGDESKLGADVFAEQVGAVTLYVYDAETGALTRSYDVSDISDSDLFSEPNVMHITDLEEGRYTMAVVAQQSPYEGYTRAGDARPIFRRSGVDAGSERALGSQREDLTITLDREDASDGEGYIVDNRGCPLDTLWIGQLEDTVSIEASTVAKDTVRLVCLTNKISIALRELADPTTMDVSKYSIYVEEHNSRILWNCDLDESESTLYTPYTSWNIEDEENAVDIDGNVLDAPGVTAYYLLMTPRIVKHTSTVDDGRLVVVSEDTGEKVVDLNLPSILSQGYMAYGLSSRQGYLDRENMYTVDIFLNNGKLAYVRIAINVLAWTYVVRDTELN